MSDDNKSTFTLELKDEMTGAATTAAGALGRLQGALDKDTKALAEMRKAMRNMQAGTTVNVEQYRKLSASIEATRERIGNTQTTILSMGGSFGKARQQSASLESKLAQLSGQASAMSGPLGAVVGKFHALAKAVGGGGLAVGIIAVSAALIGLTVASVKAGKALYAYGVEQANARRSEALRLEGLSKIRTLFGHYFNGIKATAGSDIQKMLDRVSASTALGRDKLVGYTEQLYKMGVRGNNLQHALEGVAITASTQGDEQAER